jgi:hypothetical protein
VDYHIAVTGTDAWRAKYQSNSINIDILNRLRPGAIDFTLNPYSYLSNTGVYVVNPQTPNLENVLLNNLNQGVRGTGDERAFESLKGVLEYSGNSDFRRADADLSVLIISDEDDFSANTSVFVSGDYNSEGTSDPVDLQPNTDPQSTYALYQDSRLTPVSEFQTFLDQTAGIGNHSVNVIGVLDVACKVQLNSSITGARIGRRYLQLVNATQGFAGSLCAFENAMNDYASAIVASHPSGSYDIQLDRDPLPGTLMVKINGRLIPEDSINGWSLDHQTLILTLHGDAVPQKDDIVSITYDFTPGSDTQVRN